MGPTEQPQAGVAELGGGHEGVGQGPSGVAYLRNKTASLGSNRGARAPPTPDTPPSVPTAWGLAGAPAVPPAVLDGWGRVRKLTLGPPATGTRQTQGPALPGGF